jgi:hypothetical protein
MFNKFSISSSGWVYSNLAKMARMNGGPQNLINKILMTGRVQGIVGLLVAEVGGVLTLGAMKWHSMKNGKHSRNIITNPYVNCPDSETRFEHRSGLSDDDGYLEGPNYDWSI